MTAVPQHGFDFVVPGCAGGYVVCVPPRRNSFSIEIITQPCDEFRVLSAVANETNWPSCLRFFEALNQHFYSDPVLALELIEIGRLLRYLPLRKIRY